MVSILVGTLIRRRANHISHRGYLIVEAAANGPQWPGKVDNVLATRSSSYMDNRNLRGKVSCLQQDLFILNLALR